MITTTQAARILGVSRMRVVHLIHAGRLPAKKFGERWAIREKDLELVKDRKPGRPGHQK